MKNVFSRGSRISFELTGGRIYRCTLNGMALQVFLTLFFCLFCYFYFVSSVWSSLRYHAHDDGDDDGGRIYRCTLNGMALQVLLTLVFLFW